jgi:two-component system LytT family response regulator
MDEIIKVVLVDDEPGNLQNLEDLLARYCPPVKVLAKAINLGEAKVAIETHQPDLVLLDIQLGQQNGFDLLINAPIAFEVVFVTAFSEYGIKAIKFAALDYLLKPVNPTELQQAIEKVQKKKNAKTQQLQIDSLLQYLQKQVPSPLHRIALPSSKETRLVSPEEIIRCESMNSYTKFMLKNGEQLMISKPIFEYESLLTDFGFIRCHQSHLVNTQCIKSHIKEGHGSFVLSNGEEIPISRLKKEMVKEILYKVR